MLRSPFFYFLILLFCFSCKKETIENNKVEIDKEKIYKIRDQGVEDFKNKNYNSAFYNFNKSKIAFEILRDSVNLVYNLIQMASIQQINDDYYGSKETLTEALPYLKKKDIYSVSINNFFGIADKELLLYNDAIYYYNEAIKDADNNISKISPLNNIAVIYTEQKKYDKAIQILESILNEKQISEKSKGRALDNLGFAYFKMGSNKKGLSLMNEGLEIKNQSQDLYSSIASYLHLSEYYTSININKSNEYAQKAYNIATNLNSVDERLKSLAVLISNGSGTQYSKKYISINDSITNIRNNFKNKFAKIKYDSKKEKDENQKLRLEKAEDLVAIKEAEKDKVVLYAAIIVIVITIVSLGLYLRKRYKHKTRLVEIKTAYNTETRIAKNIHDELANDVFHAITFTQTQSLTTENSKEPLLQKLNHIYSRVRGISRENSNVDTGINFSYNLKEMLSTYNTANTNVIITNIEKISWNDIEDEKKVIIHRVLQELMVNMKKHSNASIVVLKFNNNSNLILIDYSDDGKGCEKSQIIKNGLLNMENRILSSKGTITFETEPDKGFKVKITMPK